MKVQFLPHGYGPLTKNDSTNTIIPEKSSQLSYQLKQSQRWIISYRCQDSTKTSYFYLFVHCLLIVLTQSPSTNITAVKAKDSKPKMITPLVNVQHLSVIEDPCFIITICCPTYLAIIVEANMSSKTNPKYMVGGESVCLCVCVTKWD